MKAEHVRTHFATAVLISILFALFSVSASLAQKPPADPAYPPALFQIQKNLSGFFYAIGLDLAHNVDEISKFDLKSPEARAIIAGIFQKHRYIVNCATVDKNGILVAVEPPAARDAEGKSIAGQAHYEKLKATKKPVLSNIFNAVEGYPAIAIQYPILSPAGEFAGSLSILIKPEEYFAGAITSQTQGYPIRTWLIQTDGTMLFSPNAGEFGKNIFETQNYGYVVNLKEVSEKIKNTEIGRENLELTYDPSIGETKEVAGRAYLKKNLFWSTVGLFDTKWRLLVTKPSSNKPGLAETGEKAAAALKSLAEETAFVRSAAAGARQEMIGRFNEFYSQNPGIYSIEWVDTGAVSLFGVPANKSLSDYDYNKKTIATAEFFIEAVRERKASRFEARLVEGGLGYFLVEPVFDAQNYVGSVYCIIPLE